MGSTSGKRIKSKLVANREAETLNRELTTKGRKRLDDSDFAIPEGRKYPIPDKSHARNALARVAQHGTPEEKAKVRAAVKRKFPGIDAGDEGGKPENNSLQRITANLDTVRVRHELLEGRNYLVVPMVMLTEGVHAGSNGPLYYPREELAKTPAVWNHKPIVVNHPTENGSPISACQPSVISRRKVGIIMNARFTPGKGGAPGKLRAEAWIDKEKAEKVEPRILQAVQNKSMMEVSTGLFTDNARERGKWGKEFYSSIARNYRPDHLAILPDEKGACSIEDGAGLLRNAAKEENAGIGPNLSHDEIRKGLSQAIQKRKTLPTGLSGEAGSPWIRDVYDTFCIYSHGDKMFQQGYTTDKNGGVQLTGAPAEVKGKQVYMTTDGEVINTGEAMKTEEMIEDLIDNVDSPFDEEDREYLEGCPEEKIEQFAVNAGIAHKDGQDYAGDGKDDDNGETVCDGKGQIAPKKQGSKSGATKNAKGKAEKANEDEEDEPDDDEDQEDKPVGKKGKKVMNNNRRQQPMTMNEALETMPKEMRETMVAGLRALASQKGQLIKTITANKANRFTKEQLAAKDLDELQNLAALAGPQEQPPGGGNFFGLLGDAASPVENSREEEVEEALPIPVMNFAKKEQAVA